MYTRRWCWYIHLVQVTHTQPDKGRCVYTQETPACNQMDLVAAEVNELYIISVGSYLCMQLNKELPLTGNLYHIKNWINNYPCINFSEMLKWHFQYLCLLITIPGFSFFEYFIFCVCIKHWIAFKRKWGQSAHSKIWLQQ